METDDASGAGQGGAAREFTAEAMRLPSKAQRQYAEQALARLNEIAMKDDSGSVQVSALRELLDQLLGRPMPPAPPAKQDEDALAVITAIGAELRKKLDRIAQSGGSEKSDERSD